MKVLWIFNHPAPYKIDFFNELGKIVDLDVIFERRKEDDRDPAFYYQKVINFHCKIINSLRFGYMNNYTGKVVKRIKEKKYDIIVVNGWRTFTEMKTLSYLKKHNIPYIFAINGGIIKANERKLYKKIKTKYISGARFYLAPDENSASYLKYYGADETKIRLYPYSTIYEKEILNNLLSLEEKENKKDEYGLKGKEIYVAAGQFIPRKNDAQLIKIWKNVPDNKVLVLVGSGSEQKQYEKYIKEQNISNILIKPYMPHEKLLEFFSISEASILLTKEDIYGHVVNESLSQGCPVIGSKNANSSTNLIRDGKNGFLVDILDEKQILDAINSPISEEMRKNAISTSKNNTIEIMAEKHNAFFEEYLKL